MAEHDDTTIEISDLARLRLRPGDVLVLRLREPVTQEIAARLRSQLEEAVPGCRALILDAGSSLGVIDPSEPYCRICGCTTHNPCADGCWWVADPVDPAGDLCSACLPRVVALGGTTP